MNMLAAPGKSFEGKIHALEPDANIRQVQLAFAAFQAGGDEFYKNWWEFLQDVRHGHIVPVVIYWRDQAAQFGLELMHDDSGPYLSFLYYCGKTNREVVSAIVAFSFLALQNYKAGFGLGPKDEAWVRLIGRPGWDRYLKAYGLYKDETGFISDQQEVLQHGLFGRQQQQFIQ